MHPEGRGLRSHRPRSGPSRDPIPQHRPHPRGHTCPPNMVLRARLEAAPAGRRAHSPYPASADGGPRLGRSMVSDEANAWERLAETLPYRSHLPRRPRRTSRACVITRPAGGRPRRYVGPGEMTSRGAPGERWRAVAAPLGD